MGTNSFLPRLTLVIRFHQGEVIMKKPLLILLALAMSFTMLGCAAEEPQEPEVSPTVRPVSVLNAAIADIDGGTLLLAGIGETANANDLYTADCTEAEIVGLDGNAATAADLKAGMSVAAEYEGDISGNTAARKIAVKKISILNEGADIIGFYLGALKEIYASDEALNDDIDTMAFDFSKLGNLRESEKAALMYLMAKDAGLKYVSGTYEELGAQGLIDTKNLYFPNGVLLTISTADESAESFSFDISKWRGGLGAIGSDDNKAKLKDGAWSFEPGGAWIA